MKQDVTPDGVTAELLISSAEAADSGSYFCQASNVFGKDQQLVQLLVQGSSHLLATLLDEWAISSSSYLGMTEEMFVCVREWDCGRDRTLGSIFLHEGSWKTQNLGLVS